MTLLTVGESGWLGCQPAATGRARASWHSLPEATAFRAPLLTSQIGERLEEVKKRKVGERCRGKISDTDVEEVKKLAEQDGRKRKEGRLEGKHGRRTRSVWSL